MRTSRFATKIVERIENASVLDAPGARLNAVLGKVIPSGAVEDSLSGTPIGHPLHPVLVTVPIGAWSSALVLDAAGEEDAARRLVGLGVVTALPAAATGASDWLTTDVAERRVGLVHAVLNYGAIAAFGLSWLVRRRDRHALGVGLSGAGAALVSAAGWLGGHLTYAQGVGVDTTVFETLPDDWTDAGSADDVPAEGRLGRVELDGVPVLVTRRGPDVVAMADRCTHRGAPLNEGDLDGDCVVCPWHGSAFAFDGSVQAGPATRPQPVLETRVQDGRLQLRRSDARTIGARSAGA